MPSYLLSQSVRLALSLDLAAVLKDLSTSAPHACTAVEPHAMKWVVLYYSALHGIKLLYCRVYRAVLQMVAVM